jgi:molecular chaperone DnaJ
MLGVMQTSEPCPKCGGKGTIIHQPCKKCHGQGTEKRQRTITVSIPQGADSNQTFSLGGEGHAGRNGGPSGDLLVTVSVRPHDKFVRDGNSVLYEMPITVTQAILGADLTVPTLDGDEKLSIHEGTQPGETFCLRGKGIPYMRSSRRGDQYVTVKVVVPTDLTSEQKEIARQFDETLGGDASHKSHKFKRKK